MRKLCYVTSLCIVLLLLSNAQAQDAGNPPVKEPALRRELLNRVEQDQAIRNELISKGVKKPDPAILARMQAIDAANTERMKAVVSQYGWPGPELVGRDGAEAAFLLVQHADHAFQKEMLPLVEKAYRSGGLAGQSYALLLDRVLVGEVSRKSMGRRRSGLRSGRGKSLYCSR